MSDLLEMLRKAAHDNCAVCSDLCGAAADALESESCEGERKDAAAAGQEDAFEDEAVAEIEHLCTGCGKRYETG